VKVNIADLWRIEDTVYETGSWSYTYTPTGKSERTSSGKSLTTWKLQAHGEWKMVADISLP
jgi:ketosteroid isomerase-like protein